MPCRVDYFFHHTVASRRGVALLTDSNRIGDYLPLRASREVVQPELREVDDQARPEGDLGEDPGGRYGDGSTGWRDERIDAGVGSGDLVQSQVEMTGDLEKRFVFVDGMGVDAAEELSLQPKGTCGQRKG